jgi:hypothetical protein
MNTESIKQAIGPLIGAIAGFIAAKLGGDVTTWTNILLGAVTLGASVYYAWRGRQDNAVATVNAMTDVKGVIVTPSLAAAIPAATVVSDPQAAASIASKPV